MFMATLTGTVFPERSQNMRRHVFCLAILLLVISASHPTLAQKHKETDQDIFKEAQAAEETSGGNAAAEFVLGDSYEHGRGIPQDYAEALRWYLKSANRGLPAAQVALAWLYFGHSPITRCTAEEVHALTEKIAAGNATPEILDRSLFCAKDSDSYWNIEEAYFWVDVALASDQSVKQGGLSKDSRERARLFKFTAEGGVLHEPVGDKTIPGILPPEKIAAAQARATKWFAEHH